MKEKYRTIHVTFELGQFSIGGIGTVVSKLYDNRNNDDGFIFICPDSIDRNYYYYDFRRQDSDIFVFNLNEFINLREIPFKYDRIVFHNPQVFDNHKFKLNGESFFVMHSNLEMEAVYNKDLSDVVHTFWEAVSTVGKTIAVSNYDKMLLERMVQQKKNIRNLNVGVIHNGIELPKEEKIVVKKSKMLGYLGRLDVTKGLFYLVEEMKNIDDYTLLLATGGGQHMYAPISKMRLATSCNALPKNKVYSIGFSKGERFDNFLNTIEALVIPSFYEPFGMTVLEAMKAGCLVIASNYGGPREILGDNYPFLFDPNVRGDFKRILEVFKNTSDDVKVKLIKQNYEKIRNHFSVEKMINSYRTIEV